MHNMYCLMYNTTPVQVNMNILVLILNSPQINTMHTVIVRICFLNMRDDELVSDWFARY